MSISSILFWKNWEQHQQKRFFRLLLAIISSLFLFFIAYVLIFKPDWRNYIPFKLSIIGGFKAIKYLGAGVVFWLAKKYFQKPNKSDIENEIEVNLQQHHQ